MIYDYKRIDFYIILLYSKLGDVPRLFCLVAHLASTRTYGRDLRTSCMFGRLRQPEITRHPQLLSFVPSTERKQTTDPITTATTTIPCHLHHHQVVNPPGFGIQQFAIASFCTVRLNVVTARHGPSFTPSQKQQQRLSHCQISVAWK